MGILQSPFKHIFMKRLIQDDIMGGSIAGSKNEEVKTRLEKYLLKDETGVRKSLLNFFLQVQSCTTGEVYDYLIKEGFNVNYKAVIGMVGQMHSRLGILRIYRVRRGGNVYSIKENYWDLVKMLCRGMSTIESDIRPGRSDNRHQ